MPASAGKRFATSWHSSNRVRSFTITLTRPYFCRALRGWVHAARVAAWRVENRHSPWCRMFTTSHADWLALKCGRTCRPQMRTTPIDHAKRGLTCSKPPVVATRSARDLFKAC